MMFCLCEKKNYSLFQSAIYCEGECELLLDEGSDVHVYRISVGCQWRGL